MVADAQARAYLQRLIEFAREKKLAYRRASWLTDIMEVSTLWTRDFCAESNPSTPDACVGYAIAIRQSVMSAQRATCPVLSAGWLPLPTRTIT